MDRIYGAVRTRGNEVPKKKPEADDGIKRLSFDQFYAKHESEFAERDDVRQGLGTSMNALANMTSGTQSRFKLDPFSLRMYELRHWWLVRLLTAAGRENSPAAYFNLLEYWLLRMGAVPPEGVFVPPPGSPGRPRSENTEAIYQKWVTIGKPSPTSGVLAIAFYRDKYSKAGAKERKKMRDACGQAVRRHLRSLSTTKSPSR
jgi:hypothetical protein